MICNAEGELSLFDLNDNSTVHFLETLITLSSAYEAVHKYLSLFICIFGSAANSVHIYVLTRPAMHRCAVNRLLGIIAVCDIFTMLSYLVFTLRFGFAINVNNPPEGYSLPWIVFLLTHVVGSIALHTITLYLGVVTAYIRYKTLKLMGSKWNHHNRAGPIFLAVAALVLVLCIPTFLIHTISKLPQKQASEFGQVEELYVVGLTEFSTVDTCLFFKFNLWLTGIMFKVIPSLLLFIFTLALLRELELNRRRRNNIASKSSLASRRGGAYSDRTTKVLITLLLIFLTTEFPQGILAILNGLFPNDIHQFVYMSLGELLDLLSLINCNTCFIVYPLISTQYRATLRHLVRHLLRLPIDTPTAMATARKGTYSWYNGDGGGYSAGPEHSGSWRLATLYSPISRSPSANLLSPSGWSGPSPTTRTPSPNSLLSPNWNGHSPQSKQPPPTLRLDGGGRLSPSPSYVNTPASTNYPSNNRLSPISYGCVTDASSPSMTNGHINLQATMLSITPPPPRQCGTQATPLISTPHMMPYDDEGVYFMDDIDELL